MMSIRRLDGRRQRRRFATCSFIAVTFAPFLTAISAAALPGASFQGLGFLPTDNRRSQVLGISADGEVAVGTSSSFHGFKWTKAGGMVTVGDLPGGDTGSPAWGVSADGSVIVGQSSSQNGFEAYRRTDGGGLVGLGDLAGDPFGSIAADVSADGSVATGWGSPGESPGNSLAFRWTELTGMISIGDLPGGLVRSEGRGISGDGNTIVGGSFVVGNRIEAFRWTQSEGMTSIHDPTTNLSSVALDVSHDGRVIVGQLQDGNPNPFRWTPAQGMVQLPVLPAATYGQALAVSASGLFAVGSSIIGQSGVATIWNSQGNPRSIQLLLTQGFGLNLAGWQLSEASGISADGRVIVGNGIGPDGRIQAWRAEIPVPEPLFGLWLALMAPITATRRRRLLV